MLTCVTGVSGSGKSTLVHDVIYAALKRAKGDWDRRVGAHRKLEGAEFVTDVVLVDQTPIGRTPRSNPVTYLKAFDPIRELFAATKDARSRGLTASHFSFNVPGGRCEACEGEGRSQGRDAVPRRRVRALRAVRRQALQAAGARGEVPRPRHRSGARHDRPRGADLLQQLAEGAAPPAGARRDRARLPAARPAGDDAVGRRGAAHQDRRAPVVAHRRSPALHPRRADDRPALRRHRQAAGGVPQAARRPATACWSSSTTSTSSRPPTGSSTSGPEGGEEGGADRRRRHARSRSLRSRRRTPAAISRTSLAVGRVNAYGIARGGASSS